MFQSCLLLLFLLFRILVFDDLKILKRFLVFLGVVLIIINMLTKTFLLSNTYKYYSTIILNLIKTTILIIILYYKIKIECSFSWVISMVENSFVLRFLNISSCNPSYLALFSSIGKPKLSNKSFLLMFANSDCKTLRFEKLLIVRV